MNDITVTVHRVVGARIRFVVIGDPGRYIAKAGKWNKSTVKQREFYEHVKTCARAVGFDLPLMATEQNPLWFSTWSFFRTKTHADPENVHKGVKDALFHSTDPEQKGDKDKHTGGFYHVPLYDKDDPRVVIEISGWEVDKVLRERGLIPDGVVPDGLYDFESTTRLIERLSKLRKKKLTKKQARFG